MESGDEGKSLIERKKVCGCGSMILSLPSVTRTCVAKSLGSGVGERNDRLRKKRVFFKKSINSE